MSKKLEAIVNLFRKGDEISNAQAWKQGGISTAAVAAFLLAIDSVLHAYGYDLPISADQAKDIAGGVIALVGVVLPTITSARAGLLPAKSAEPDSAVSSGMPTVAKPEESG